MRQVHNVLTIIIWTPNAHRLKLAIMCSFWHPTFTNYSETVWTVSNSTKKLTVKQQRQNRKTQITTSNWNQMIFNSESSINMSYCDIELWLMTSKIKSVHCWLQLHQSYKFGEISTNSFRTSQTHTDTESPKAECLLWLRGIKSSLFIHTIVFLQQKAKVQLAFLLFRYTSQYAGMKE